MIQTLENIGKEKISQRKLDDVIKTLYTPLTGRELVNAIRNVRENPNAKPLRDNWSDLRKTNEISGTTLYLENGDLHSLRADNGRGKMHSCEIYGFDISDFRDIRAVVDQGLMNKGISCAHYDLQAKDDLRILVSPQQHVVMKNNEIVMFSRDSLVRIGNEFWNVSSDARPHYVPIRL